MTVLVLVFGLVAGGAIGLLFGAILGSNSRNGDGR